MEAYCRDITEGDLTFLEEQMKPEEGILDIPPLGKHYSNQWATEDILEEKKNGSFNMDKTDISLAMDIGETNVSLAVNSEYRIWCGYL